MLIGLKLLKIGIYWIGKSCIQLLDKKITIKKLNIYILYLNHIKKYLPHQIIWESNHLCTIYKIRMDLVPVINGIHIPAVWRYINASTLERNHLCAKFATKGLHIPAIWRDINAHTLERNHLDVQSVTNDSHRMGLKIHKCKKR